MRVKRRIICTKKTLDVKQCMPRINKKNKLTNILPYNVSSIAKYILFSDDTNVFYSANSPELDIS